MKKTALILLLLIGSLANALAGDGKVSRKTLDNFQAKFAGAENINWTINREYFKASFNMDGHWLNAYYNRNGRLLSVTRNISTPQLPLFLLKDLREKYAGYWITEIFELSNEDGFSYYMTLENADQRIVLRSIYGSPWTIYQTSKKL